MRKLALFLASIAVTSPAFAATNLIQNGSFESGMLEWDYSETVSSGTGYSAPVVIKYGQNGAYPTGAFGEAVPADNNPDNPGLDPVGEHFLYLSSDLGTQTVWQQVALDANTSYTFGFDYYLPQNGMNNPNGVTFTASLDGNPFATFALGSQQATTWLFASSSADFTTGNNAGNFMFSFSADGYTAKDIGIDRVFLAKTESISPVPEPASWAMMLCGFGLLGATLRHRKPTVRFA